ncbi:hypothetical protein RSO67_14145 [Tardiphaga sp. 709]|nr:hypothetical protein [Tardiphaga sp. 709]WNV12215.1 hypothetical protein RSO67_14145 [Tardiphaga sp. 709]
MSDICSRIAAITASMRRWLASIAARRRVTFSSIATLSCSSRVSTRLLQLAIENAEQHVLATDGVPDILQGKNVRLPREVRA